MSRAEELAFRAADGTALHARFWPGTEPRGVLVIAHGVGEHGGCYEPTALELTARPGLVDVLAFDFRGHGRSAGRRGIVRRYEDLIQDLDAALAEARRLRPGRPVFVLGHSNGGQVVLRQLIDGSEAPPCAGVILSNPALRLAIPVPPVKALAGRVLDRVLPGLSLRGTVASDWLSRDPAYDVRRRADPLRHERLGPRLFFGMIAGGPRLLAEAGRVALPALVIVGEADPLIDPAATRQLFETLGSPDKALLVAPGGRHEPLNDVGREQTLAALIGWLERHLPGA